MVHYHFKSIRVVSDAPEMIDVCLSNTQTRTPTEIHKQFKISRIRQFYMRKIKTLQQFFCEKLNIILTDFPQIQSIHPFYSDLLNVLYDKDHYKLALSQISTVKSRIEAIGRDYVRLMKYGENLYQLKRLKIAGMGRMCTLIKKLKSALEYLEQVRQHMSRLPDVNPTAKTLLLCGYPNVGKSSFLNKVTNADVDVQSYAFTTKSLFVGHMDYKYARWQVIDTPGILDHPLEDRNTIEMISITALAHLRAAILFLVDISKTSHYTIETQLSLFKSIMPLFHGKPVVLLLTKCDINGYSELDQEDKNMIDEMKITYKDLDIKEISNVTGDGIMDARNFSCDKLLQQRVDAKISKIDGMDGEEREKSSLLRRLHVSEPSKKPAVRPPVIPESVRRRQETTEAVAIAKSAEVEPFSKPIRHSHDADQHRVREDGLVPLKEIVRQRGGTGLYQVDLNKDFLLDNDEWKYDKIPEIMDGKNIADYIDKDIMEKLGRLEDEEEERKSLMVEDDVSLDPESQEQLKEIRKRKKIIIEKRRLTRNKKQKLPKDVLEEVTVRTKRKRRERREANEDIEMGAAEGGELANGDENPDSRKQRKLSKGERKAVYGEAGGKKTYDRMPKHLYSGKRGFGADRR